MSEFAGFDLDRSTARAWSTFQTRLADRVAAMEDDDVICVEAESPVDGEDASGSAPYVQFCAWGEGLARCEVSSNEYLAPEHRLDDAGATALGELGWSAPTHGRDDEGDSGSANFFFDIERNHADQLAVMTVRAFRDVFGVEHPAFLSSTGLTDEIGEGEATAAEGAGLVPNEVLAIVPDTREHLQALVDDALAPVFDGPPEHDEDDDIPVVAGSGLIWVRVLEHSPTVQLFAVLVSAVTDRERAAFEVTVLNRDIPFVKFVLAEDSVLAYLYLSAYPFAPMQLRAALAMMSDVVDRVDDDLVVRVGGRRALEPLQDESADSAESAEDAEHSEPLHPAMLTLLQLDVDSPGSVDPELAANICEMDRDLVLELISWNSAQELAWRRSRDEALISGDADDEAETCAREMQHAEQMTNLLRRALRVVVESTVVREPRPGYDIPPGVRRRGRRPADPALPGLDDEEQGLWE